MSGRATNESGNYFAFGFQSAKDSEATTFQFLRHLDGTGFETESTVEEIQEGGDGQQVSLRIKTAVSADGQWVENARPETFHRAMVAALGADTAVATHGLATGATGIVNEHLATPTDALPYLTVEQRWADNIERTSNVHVTGLTIDFEAGRPLRITPEFISGGSAYKRPIASALTPTRETGRPFMYPGATVVIDGAGNAKVTKGSIRITRDVDGDIRTTGLNREDVVVTSLKTSVALTLKYESATGSLVDKVNYAGPNGTQVPHTLATGSLKLSALLGAGTAMRALEVGVNQLEYTNARVNKLNPVGQTMYVDVTGEGFGGATHQVFARTTIATAAAVV